MRFCLYPLHPLPRKQPWYSAWSCPLQKIFSFKAICAATLLAASPLFAADSLYPLPDSGKSGMGSSNSAAKNEALYAAITNTEALYAAITNTDIGATAVAANDISTEPTETPALKKIEAPLSNSPAKSDDLYAAITNTGIADTTTADDSTTNAAGESSTNAMDALDNHYELAIGDTVDFQVIEDEDDAKPIVVSDSGDIEVPYIGRYPAMGKTCKTLARELKAALEKKYYYQATVIISVKSMVSQGVIYLVGGVRAPGPQEIPRDDVLTISKAILRAGGFDDFADQSHVRVTRKADGTNEVFEVNISRVLDKGKTSEDPRAEPGDLIYIPEKTFRF